MTAKLLILEDEPAIADILEYAFKREGYSCIIVNNGDMVLPVLQEQPIDIVLIDWMVPGRSGFDLCRLLRARPDTNHLGLIMLTARNEDEDKIRGLEIGADDYIAKPFVLKEVLARVRALYRRIRATTHEVMIIGDLTLDPVTHRVHRSGREVKLGHTEFRLLETLMSKPGRVYSREQLLDLVWGQDINVEIRTVDVHVGRMRKALNDAAEQDPIRTVRSEGYAFDEYFGKGSS